MNDKTHQEQQAGELSGTDGQHVTGGDRTPKQNAGARLDELNDQRHGERRMEGRQMAGVVESQTQVHRPSASEPGGEFPTSVEGQIVDESE